MEKKTRWLVPSVTTTEAMKACIAQNVCAFCIENPLYSEICDELNRLTCISNYEMEIYADKQIVILRKAGFNDRKYELAYLPLQWDGWRS